MNNFDSNFTEKLAKGFLTGFESSRVLSKNVNTQLLDGKFEPDDGDQTFFRRPTDYRTVRTPDGDVSAETKSSIITGRAVGRVQPYFTAFVDYKEADEAIKMGNVTELLAPMGTRMKTDIELDFAAFMLRNNALSYGTVGTPSSTWNHVAGAGATLKTTGVPEDGMWNYAMNPFMQVALADQQRGLGTTGTVDDANKRAVVMESFAGMRVLSATTLESYFTGAGADRVGTLASDPDATYVTAKDTMQQTLSLANFQANLEIKAGETIQIAGRNRLNLSTRRPIVDNTGSQILFTATVLADVTLSGTGTGNIVVSGPAINEVNGQYNTVDSAPLTGDIVTILGAPSTIYQPSMFWHKNAFSIGSVPIQKLHSTDTLATTKDGLQFRVSKGSQFLENVNQVRIDFRPAYSCLNPFFAGLGWG